MSGISSSDAQLESAGHSYREKRYWRREVIMDDSWWPWGWLPLIGLGLVFLWGLFATSSSIEESTQERVQEALVAAGYNQLEVDVNGQEVTVSGVVSEAVRRSPGLAAGAASALSFDEEKARIAGIARGAECDDGWFASDLVCSTDVVVDYKRVALKAETVKPAAAAIPVAVAKPALARADREAKAVIRCNEEFASVLSRSTIRFRTSSAEIDPQSLTTLSKLAEVAQRCPIPFRDEGHTDSVGAREFNQKLSRARAESVVVALVEAGANRERLQFEGFGPDRPIASNATSDGRARNRRIEIKAIENN